MQPNATTFKRCFALGMGSLQFVFIDKMICCHFSYIDMQVWLVGVVILCKRWKHFGSCYVLLKLKVLYSFQDIKSAKNLCVEIKMWLACTSSFRVFLYHRSEFEVVQFSVFVSLVCNNSLRIPWCSLTNNISYVQITVVLEISRNKLHPQFV